MSANNFQVSVGSVADPLTGAMSALNNVGTIFRQYAADKESEKRDKYRTEVLAQNAANADRNYQLNLRAQNRADAEVARKKTLNDAYKTFAADYNPNGIGAHARAMARNTDALTSMNDNMVTEFNRRKAAAEAKGKTVNLDGGMAGSGLFTPAELAKYNNAYKAPVIKEDEEAYLHKKALSMGLPVGTFTPLASGDLSLADMQKRLDAKAKATNTKIREALSILAKPSVRSSSTKPLTHKQLVASDPYRHDFLTDALSHLNSKSKDPASVAKINGQIQTLQKMYDMPIKVGGRQVKLIDAYPPQAIIKAVQATTAANLPDKGGFLGFFENENGGKAGVRKAFLKNLELYKNIPATATAGTTGSTRTTANNAAIRGLLKTPLISKDARQELYRAFARHNPLLGNQRNNHSYARSKHVGSSAPVHSTNTEQANTLTNHTQSTGRTLLTPPANTPQTSIEEYNNAMQGKNLSTAKKQALTNDFARQGMAHHTTSITPEQYATIMADKSTSDATKRAVSAEYFAELEGTQPDPIVPHSKPKQAPLTHYNDGSLIFHSLADKLQYNLFGYKPPHAPTTPAEIRAALADPMLSNDARTTLQNTLNTLQQHGSTTASSQSGADVVQKPAVQPSASDTNSVSALMRANIPITASQYKSILSNRNINAADKRKVTEEYLSELSGNAPKQLTFTSPWFTNGQVAVSQADPKAVIQEADKNRSLSSIGKTPTIIAPPTIDTGIVLPDVRITPPAIGAVPPDTTTAITPEEYRAIQNNSAISRADKDAIATQHQQELDAGSRAFNKTVTPSTLQEIATNPYTKNGNFQQRIVQFLNHVNDNKAFSTPSTANKAMNAKQFMDIMNSNANYTTKQAVATEYGAEQNSQSNVPTIPANKPVQVPINYYNDGSPVQHLDHDSLDGVLGNSFKPTLAKPNTGTPVEKAIVNAVSSRLLPAPKLSKPALNDLRAKLSTPVQRKNNPLPTPIAGEAIASKSNPSNRIPAPKAPKLSNNTKEAISTPENPAGDITKTTVADIPNLEKLLASSTLTPEDNAIVAARVLRLRLGVLQHMQN